MQAIAAQLRSEHPATNKDLTVHLRPLHEQMVATVRPALLALMVAVGLVLLIACANVANLLLARSVLRHREMAIRTALGARRGRLLRQMLIEALVLSFFGGAVGLVLAGVGIKLLLGTIPAELLVYFPYLKDASVDGTVLGFTLALSLLTAVICGLVPALQSSRKNPQGALQAGGAQTTASGARQRLRDALVVAEIAFAAVLLITSGLAVRSLLTVLSVPTGFATESLLTARASLPGNRYRDPAKVLRVAQETLSRLAVLPGVRSAAILSSLPMAGADFSLFSTENQTEPSSHRPALHFTAASSGALRTLGIPLKRGREFTAADQPESVKVVVINETLARRYFPNEDPVGKRIAILRLGSEMREIVGVAGDIRDFSLDLPTEPAVYLPLPQAATAGHSGDLRLVLRTDHPLSLGHPLRQTMTEIEPDAPISELRTMDDLVSQSPMLLRRRLPSLLAGALALSALLLAAVGISSVLSSAVNQRVKEIGIRVALGADPGRVLRMIFGQTIRLIVSGLVLGIAGGFAAARVISGWLYGVTPSDLITYVSVTATLILVGLVSCYVPARRATRLDPILALRHD